MFVLFFGIILHKQPENEKSEDPRYIANELPCKTEAALKPAIKAQISAEIPAEFTLSPETSD